MTGVISNLDKIGPKLGIVREGVISKFDSSTGTITVRLAGSDNNIAPVEQSMSLPSAWSGPNGEFCGGYPIKGAHIWCLMGHGGAWTALGYGRSDDVWSNPNTSNLTGYSRNLMTGLQPGRWLAQVRNNVRLMADPKIGVQIGDLTQFIQPDPIRSIISTQFSQSMEFTDAGQQINGLIRRDLISTPTRMPNDSPLTSHQYQDSLTIIGLDPSTTPGNNCYRNPPLVESREIIYEFSRSFGFTNDKIELQTIGTDQAPVFPNTLQRTDSRADTLNMSLAYPNYLIESTKGTVVDLYGNILDINRSVLPSGHIGILHFGSSEATEENTTFINLREQLRKSIAYHFEINARKSEDVPDVNSTADYARNRSRFSIDIDKEGQFKINAPASSEVGNVPLLTRSETYSAIESAQNSINDPNRFVQNTEQDQDIYLDAFGAGAISLTSNSDSLKAYAAPIDRITGNTIKLGTAYHDITQGLALQRRKNTDDANIIFGFPDSKLNSVTPIEHIVSDTVIVSGEGANAGGRSGTVNLDGSLSLSIGANTVDRQSLWLDCAGGTVANIGRDGYGVSAAWTLDGDLLVQIGGSTVSNDSRFTTDNGNRAGTFDIRVLSGSSQMHVIRIDATGVRIHSAGEVDIVAEQTLRLKSVRGNIALDCEDLFFYTNGSTPRLINRKGSTVG
jgi:hypothetical protein